MFGATYVTVVGFICEDGILCRDCARKAEDAGELRMYTEACKPVYQYQADELPEGEELTCDACEKIIGE